MDKHKHTLCVWLGLISVSLRNPKGLSVSAAVLHPTVRPLLNKQSNSF